MRRLSTALTAIVLLVSCGQQTNNTQQPDSLATPKGSAQAAKRSAGNVTSIISRYEAAVMISAFLNQPNLGEYAIDKTLGGIFERSVFELDDTKAGALLWFCFNQKEPGDRQWFLAASKAGGYTPAVTREASDDLWKPYDFFKYTGASKDTTDVLTFIESHQYGAPGKSPVLPQAEARMQVEDFMTTLLPSFDPKPGQLMKYPFCFFGEMSADFQIKKLLDQPGAIGVRYYFGYENKNEYGYEINNKIRVILVAIDKYGKNILLGNKDGDGDIMIEKAFPPPPSSND